MKKHLIMAAIALACATAADAHSSLTSTIPADGTTLTTPPTQIEFNFSGKLRLTKVEASLSGAAPQPIDLDAYKTFTDAYVLPIPPLGAGLYQIEWRGLGMDGHAMQGTFSFEVK